MISIYMPVIIILSYSIIVGLIGMDSISRSHRSVQPHIFNPSTSLVTISPFYNALNSIPNQESAEKNQESDSISSKYKKSLHIDDSDILSKKIGLTCNPSNLGYSIKNGEFVFPNYTYPSCSVQTDKNTPKMRIDLDSNTFYMSCEKGDPYYILEPIERKGRLFQYDEILPYYTISEYKNPVKLSTQEYAFGSCDGGETFTNAVNVFRKDAKVLEEAKEKMNSLSPKNKPLIVFMLTVDSFSRRHFYRKLPKTIKYFNNGIKDFSIFDFKLHNVIGQSSIENIVPIFSGNFYLDIPLTESTVPREYDVHKNDSMWTLFKSKGFVTMFGLENCDYYFPNALGRNLNIDHKVRTFYCTARGFMNLDTEIHSRPVQRCIGERMSHWYTLNYANSFSKSYQEVNQWIYIHLNTAHEATGQHAGTLDDDLLETLQNYTEKFSKTHEIAIFLHADHGMRYGNWYQDVEAYQENKLPVFFLIISNTLLSRIPNSINNLIENTERLTVKKDLRATINYLADMPYTVNGKSEEPSKLLNLFLQKSPLNRTCESLNISPFECSCLVIKEIKNYTDDSEFLSLIMKVIEIALFKMNSLVNTPYSGQFGLCKKLTFREILNVYGMALNNKVEEVQIKFGVNENIRAVFEVFAFVGTHTRSEVLISSSYRSSIVSFVYRGNKTRIKVFGIKRKDKYAGICEYTSRSLKIKAEYCICNEDKLSIFSTD